MRLLLTHGYILAEDPKEQRIMKPYAPLGILSLSAHLRDRGFEVDIYDSTFGSRQELFGILDAGPPAALGIYGNLMTRRNVLDFAAYARAAGWIVILGGPEPSNYAEEFLAAGADLIVAGEAEWALERLLATGLTPHTGPLSLDLSSPPADPPCGLDRHSSSPTSTPSPGPIVSESISPVISRSGASITVPAPSPSLPLAAVPTIATGAATPSMESRTAAVLRIPLLTRLAGFSNATSRKCSGSLTTSSLSIPDGSSNSLPRCTVAACTFRSNASPAPTALVPRSPRRSRNWAAFASGSARKADRSAYSMPCGAASRWSRSAMPLRFANSTAFRPGCS